MSGLLQHLKISAIPDGTDPSQVQPSDWNAAHVFAGGNHGAIPVRDTTDATYGSNWLASVALGQVLTSAGVGALPAWTASLVLSGRLTVNGFGEHQFSATGTGLNVLRVINATAGVDNFAMIAAQNNVGENTVLMHFSNTFASPVYAASSGALQSNGPGGLLIAAYQAAGTLRLAAGGGLPQATLGANGHWGINTAPDGPAAAWIAILAAGAHGVYSKADTANMAAIRGDHSVNSATGYSAFFYNTTSGAGQYLAAAGTWAAVSDRRLKTDIRPLDTLDGLRAIAPRDFLWKSHADSDQPGVWRQFGFIAQEIAAIFPNLVTPSPDGMLGVHYTGLIAPLVEGWQDHDARIAALEREREA